MSRVKDLTGIRFGRLVAIKQVGIHHSGQALWRCTCDCGKLKDVPSSKLVRNNTRSCGCLLLETQQSNGKKEPGYAAMALVYREYKKGAKRRGLDFDLTVDEFVSLSTSDCHYCGNKPSRVTVATGNNGQFLSNGIDRINNSVGYVLGNVVPCCYVCNRAKMDMTYSEFLSWVTRVYRHHAWR
jgi:hypothetical protein